MSEITSRINVFVNGSEAAKSLKELTAESDRLSKELEGMTEGTDAFVKKSKELAKVGERVVKMTADYDKLVKEAGGGLDTIIAKQKQLAAELAKPDLSKEKRAELIADLKKTNLQYDQMTKILNGVKKEGVSINDLERYQRALTKEIKNSALSAEELEAKYKELNRVKLILDEHRAKLKGVNEEIVEHKEKLADVSQSYTLLSGGMGRMIGMTAGVFVAGEIASYGAELLNVREKVRAYGSAVSELQAITGVSGAGLKDLESRAESLTEIITDGGEKITNTSADILKAFQLVGSAKPELLKDAEGMQSVTKEAIIMSQAMKDTLPNSIEFLTTIMEQFNAPADQSRRYINAMAAGAKEGSIEIKESANAVQKFGAVSKSMNVSVEESIGLIQTMGKTFKSGEETGTALRNVLLKIAAPENLPKEALEGLAKYDVSLVKLKDNTIPLSERLKELSKVQQDTALMGKIFGTENIVAGQVILGNIPKFEALTKAVTGTNEAYAQAAVMADNLANDEKNLKNEIDKAATGIGNSLTPAIRGMVQGMTEGVKWVREHADTIIFWGKVLIESAVVVGSHLVIWRLMPIAIQAWTVAKIALTTVYELFTGKVKLATVAQELFNIVAKANPLGVLITVVTAAVTAWEMYKDTVNEATKVKKLLKNATESLSAEMAKETAQSDVLFRTLKSETASRAEKNAAIKKLREMYPDYLQYIDLEKASSSELEGIQQRLNQTLRERIAIRMKDAAMSSQQEVINAKMMRITEIEKGGSIGFSEQMKYGKGGIDLEANRLSVVQNMRREVAGLQDDLKNIEQKFDDTFQLKDKGTADRYGEEWGNPYPKAGPKMNNTPAPVNTGEGGKAVDEAKEALKKFNEELKNFDNDIAQRAATQEAAEELKIKEKYQKQIDALEEFKKNYPSKKAEADKLEKAFTERMNTELIALNVSKLNSIQKDIDKYSQLAYEKNLTAEAREIAHIKAKYADDLAYLKNIEEGKIKVTEDAKIKAHAQYIALEAAQQAELDAIENKKLQEEAKRTEEFELQRAKGREDAKKKIVDELNKTIAPDATASTPQYLEQLKTTQQLELAQLSAHFADLLALADDYGLNVEALKKKQAETEAAIDKKYKKQATDRQLEDNQKKLQAYSTLFSELGNIAASAGELFAQQGEKQSSFQKVMTIAQIAMDTAAAISSLTAHSEKNPANSMTFGAAGTIQFITGLARILTNVSRAKKVLTEAPVVKQKYEGGFSDDYVTGASDNQRYKVNYVGRPKTGMLPDSPIVYPSASGFPVLASEKGREFLVSNPDLSVPAIFDHVRAIINIKRNGSNTSSTTQMREGGFTDNIQIPINTTNTTGSELAIELKRFNDIIEKGIVAIVPDDTVSALFRRYELLNKASGYVLKG